MVRALILFFLCVVCAFAVQNAPTGALDAIQSNNAGIALLEQHQFQKAAETFQKALTAHPDSVPLMVNLAISKFNLQDYDQALSLLNRAAEVEPRNPYVCFNRGLIYKNRGDQDKAIAEFRQVTEIDPKDPTSFYNLGVLQLRDKKYDAAIKALEQAVALEKNNLPAYFNLGMAFMRKGDQAEGTKYLDLFQKLQQRAPDVEPSGAGQQYTELGKYSLALESTPGPRPRPQAAAAQATWQPSFFSEVGISFGLTSQLFEGSVAAGGADERAPATGLGFGAAAADYDDDGRVDLLLVRGKGVVLLHNEGGGSFRDASEQAQVHSDTTAMSAVFGDYDNDGKPDLYISSAAGSGALLHNAGSGKFEEKSGASGIQDKGSASAAGWVDYDHDGDLDLLVAHLNGPPSLFRNNGNGTFTDVSSEAGLAAHKTDALGLAAYDFDNDRDVDLLVSGYRAPSLFFGNERDGTFRETASALGLGATGSNLGVAAGDVNGDGTIDLLFTREQGDLNLLLTNDGQGFVLDADSPALLASLARPAATRRSGSLLADLDNDGDLDAIFLADAELGPQGIVAEVFENRDGRFVPWCRIMNPESDKPVHPRGAVAADFDGDGKLDLLINNRRGRPLLFRNNHPNQNHWLSLTPAGLRSNKSGYGTKIEVRAGSAYQKLEVSSTAGYLSQNSLPVHIGLGSARTVDRLRLLWPSGIIQSESDVAADRALKIGELNRKATSCPLLYGWDGRRFQFITDFLGGSAIGYQTEPGTYEYPDTDEYVRIPGEALIPKAGRLLLRMNNQLEEVMYFDKAELLAVDHPASTDIYPNERLMPSRPFPDFKIHQVSAPRPPLHAWDDRGKEVTAWVRSIDRTWPEGFELLPYKGYAKTHALTLDFGDVTGARQALLLLHAWIDYADSSSNRAAVQAGVQMVHPYIEVQREDGKWAPAVESMGFPAGLPKTMTVDLNGLLPRSHLVLRIVTSMRLYWDQILLDTSVSTTQPVVTRIKPVAADLRFKGYPEAWSPDGREPAGYVYDRAASSESWRVHAGDYTRFGDVLPLLQDIDDQYVITRHGDEVALEFDARRLPPLPAGWKRDYLFYADGFGKDMDLNSAYPHTVEPLPFHGMKGYPYAEGEKVPDSEKLREYRRRYNTRRFTSIYDTLENLATERHGNH